MKNLNRNIADKGVSIRKDLPFVILEKYVRIRLKKDSLYSREM